MEQLSAYMPYFTSIICALISGIVTYIVSRKQTKNEINKLIKQHELNLESQRKQYEHEIAILNLELLLDIVFGLVRMVKPVVYGCVIAYTLNPLVNQCNLIARKCYQKLRWTWTAKTEKTMNGISICLSLIIAIIIIAILMWLIIPQLVITVAGLINTLPDEIALYYQKIT